MWKRNKALQYALERHLEINGKPKKWDDFLADHASQLRYSSLKKMEHAYVDYCWRFRRTIGDYNALFKGYYGPVPFKDLVYSRNPLLELMPKDGCNWAGSYIPVPLYYGKVSNES